MFSAQTQTLFGWIGVVQKLELSAGGVSADLQLFSHRKDGSTADATGHAHATEAV